ncbi:dihydrolipoyl dehydrogenase family protein [Roseibium litorale]|uniref:FAD-dependent oxidoreductase n=1 Tax=Roseibium litorale TaxID=2803841 RepID=A0ABR9CN96_9HYPH|nr:FAD-dependent oxidoreductase [Roseibium litorale]MBD8892292.1 FAD-dependent oxidoreductase [Roseibium litorale]
MSGTVTPDICVIGAGSAGLSVAAAAAAFGVEVVLIEKGEMGGDCLNHGCVPSKALLSAAREAVLRPVAFSEAQKNVRRAIEAIAPHDSASRFEELGVTVLRSAAEFVSAHCVRAGDVDIRARRFVIATGSRPAIPAIPGLESVPYVTNETLFGLDRLPDHLIVLGGGAIGIEMAQAHRRLGSRVTVLEAGKALGREDPEMAAIVLDALRKEGVVIRENTCVTGVTSSGVEIAVSLLQDGRDVETLSGSHLLVATGRRPSVEGLGLEKAGIRYGPGGIHIDDGLRTSNRRVYAIGDVTGGPQFTHAANYQAGLVIRSALFRLPVKASSSGLPRVLYTAPELGHAGLSEEEARKKYGARVRVVSASYSGNDRAVTENLTTGRLKLIAGPGGRLIGAEIAGAQAGELINSLSLAIFAKMTMRDLAGFVTPYPTLGELIRRAALSYYADVPRRLWVRRLLAFLRLFG